MQQYKLVIVENDEDERFFMKQGFQASGAFDILGEFSNGDTLFDWLAKKPTALPDIVLSDLNMPGKNGYDIISELKSNPSYSHIQLIITSTSSVIAVREKCLSMGAWDYVIKPEIFIDYGPYVEKLYQKLKRKGVNNN